MTQILEFVIYLHSIGMTFSVTLSKCVYVYFNESKKGNIIRPIFFYFQPFEVLRSQCQ